MITQSKSVEHLCKLLLLVGLVSCLLVGDVMAGKNKGSEDIILYNGNIVMRGGKGKGKGGSIVVANSPQSETMMPMFGWGGMYKRR